MSNVNDLFVVASRKKYRFDSTKGKLTVEDLWSLSLTDLNGVAVAIDDKIQALGRKSFIAKTSASSTDAENQLEIVKTVIATKQTEAETAKTRLEKESQRTFLKSLLEKKKMEQLEGLSTAEIEAQIAQLSNV